jgi:hypothetical protein
MKHRLGAFENIRTFYSPLGNQTIVRDTVVNQTPPPEPIKEVVEEAIQEIVEPIIEEPVVVEQPTTPKTKRSKQ